MSKGPQISILEWPISYIQWLYCRSTKLNRQETWEYRRNWSVTWSVTAPEWVKFGTPSMETFCLRCSWAQWKHIYHHSRLLTTLQPHNSIQYHPLIIVCIWHCFRPSEQISGNLHPTIHGTLKISRILLSVQKATNWSMVVLKEDPGTWYPRFLHGCLPTLYDQKEDKTRITLSML